MSAARAAKPKLTKEEKAAAKFARGLAWFERETSPAKMFLCWRERVGPDFIGPMGPFMLMVWAHERNAEWLARLERIEADGKDQAGN